MSTRPNTLNRKGNIDSRSTAQEDSVRVRMYRQGLGDCFLVTLPGNTDGPFRIMIDCGVLQGVDDAANKVRAVVKNIIEDTSGFVDVLVLTHEHWDHVSGFSQAKDLFAMPDDQNPDGKLSFGQVWMAWTEDPSDVLAKRLKREHKEKTRKLRSFVDGLRERGMMASSLYQGLNELMGFFGVSKNSTSGAMAFAKQLGRQSPRYFRPADPPWQDEVVPGIRIYALGPPPDEKFIKKLNSRSEVYHKFSDGALADSFFSAATALVGLEGEGASETDIYCPFNRAYWYPLDRWAKGKRKRTRTGRLEKDEIAFFDRVYGSKENNWRRIDNDWLETSADFALRLDSKTNNTSLVLAIEMVSSGRVLLFPGDAQVGSWLSWQNLSWELADGTMVAGPDLLKRTVFYKTGHHGSHNATLKEKGLEMMNADEFVAFIPVVIEQARKKRWMRMPLPGLVEAMTRRAKGRVVLMDSGPADVDPVLKNDFDSRLEENSLFFEYRIGD